jgi:hypothetical protein
MVGAQKGRNGCWVGGFVYWGREWRGVGKMDGSVISCAGRDDEWDPGA